MQIPIKDDILSPLRPESSPLLKKSLFEWGPKGYSQIVFHSPRNCGKTFHIWLLILFLVEEYPGLTVCISRNEYSTIKTSIYRTLVDKILKYPTDDPRNPFKVVGGDNRPDCIVFSNGSKIYFRGLDDVEKVKGTEPDVFWLNEAQRQQTPHAVSNVLGSMGGRGGGLIIDGKKRSLFIGDMNPTTKEHFLYQWCYEDKTAVPYAWTRKEHPEHYDWVLKDFTEYGEQTEEGLLAAYPEGFMRDRNVYGLFVGAEGLVYPFTREKIGIKKEDMPDISSWRKVHGIDFGWLKFVHLSVAVNDNYNGLDGLPQYIVYREYRYPERVLEDHAKRILEFTANEEVDYTVADHDIEDRIRLQQEGVYTIAAKKDVRVGIDVTYHAFSTNRLKILDDEEELLAAGGGINPWFRANGWCSSIWGEHSSYRYRSQEERTGNPDEDDKPYKKLRVDDAMDVLRYIMMQEEEQDPYADLAGIVGTVKVYNKEKGNYI